MPRTTGLMMNNFKIFTIDANSMSLYCIYDSTKKKKVLKFIIKYVHT